MKLLLSLLLVATGSFLASCHATKYQSAKGAAKLKDYQILLTIDTAYIYQGKKLVGACAHGKDGIDSVITKDNL